MRINLRINFGKIKELADSSKSYASSLESLHSAFEKFVSVVEKNKGLAADALKDSPTDISGKMNKLGSGLEIMSNVLNEFDTTMTGIIEPSSKEADMYIETFNAKRDIHNLREKLEGYASVSSGYKVPTFKTTVKESEISAEDAQKYAANQEEADQILRKVESLTETYKQVMKSLSDNYVDDLQKIYDKIEKFENTDDEFENKGESLYEGWLDLSWSQTTTGKIFWAAVGIAVCIGIIVGAPFIAAGAAAIGLSAGTAAMITTVVVGAAKGALIAAVATGGIDTTMAVINQEDIDSAASTGLCKGIVTGAVTGGVTAAAPYIVQAGSSAISKTVSVASKYAPGATEKVATIGSKALWNMGKVAPNTTMKLIDHGDEVAVSAIKFVGEVASDKAGTMVTGKEFNLKKSIAGAVTGQFIDSKADGIIDKLDDSIDKSKLSRPIQQGMSFGYKGGTNVLGEEAKGFSEAFIDNAIDVMESGEGSIFDFDYETDLTEPGKVMENTLSGNGVDGKSLMKRGTEKVLEFVENGFRNTRI